MRFLTVLLSTVPTLVAVVSASQWDREFGDSPLPEVTPLTENDLYPILAPGTVQPIRQTGGSKDARRQWSGRLDYKRDDGCVDPTYILVCPATENLPCCPPGYTVCCHDPSDICCQPGYFCVGTTGCCLDGTTACGTEHCCPSGSTCCNDSTCCQSGYVCQGGQCINPQLSIQSTASVQSVASVASQSLQEAITLSSISLQSVSSELNAQTRDGGDPNAIATVNVFPNDRRITYEPDSAWTDTANESGIGNCNNGTKVTTRPDANFTFVFKGTDISLYIIPTINGGPITVQIDGGQASTLSTQSTTNAGCIPAQVFTKSDLTDAAHELTVKNGGGVSGSTAGTLEFNSIVYTGKGAFGTSSNTSSKKSNSAVIGGSVGGVVGAIVLVGGGIIFWLYRKRQNGNNNAAAPATPNQPMMFAGAQPGGGTTPMTPASQPAFTPGGQDPVSPVMSQTHMSAYSGYQPAGPQPGGSGSFQQQQQPVPVWAGYQDTNRPTSSGSPPMAPLPMWVERARGQPGRDDGTSMMSGSDSASMSPGPQPGTAPGAFYGGYHPSNAPTWSGR